MTKVVVLVVRGGGRFEWPGGRRRLVKPLTTSPRENGPLLPQDPSPIANRSLLLRQGWLKNTSPYRYHFAPSQPTGGGGHCRGKGRSAPGIQAAR